MIFSSLVKTRRPKRFNYTPRYHDRRKEALKQLVETARAERDGKIPSRYDIKYERKYGIKNLL